MIHEGRILRAVVSLYKGNAEDLSNRLGITRNQLNYLYTKENLPETDMVSLQQEINSPDFYAEAKHIFFNFFHPANKGGKKNVASHGSFIQNESSMENSDISINGNGKTKQLKEVIRAQQKEINRLKKENKELRHNFTDLTSKFTELSDRLFALIQKKNEN